MDLIKYQKVKWQLLLVYLKIITKIKNQVAIIKHPKEANKVPKTLTLGALKFNAHEINTDKNTIPMETQAPGFTE